MERLRYLQGSGNPDIRRQQDVQGMGIAIRRDGGAGIEVRRLA